MKLKTYRQGIIKLLIYIERNERNGYVTILGLKRAINKIFGEKL